MSRLIAPHPFPARMAPELALEALSKKHPGSLVLDPMCGSGTVLRTAAVLGHDAIGVDMDPLAVLMANVWTSNLRANEIQESAEIIVDKAKALSVDKIHLPWIDDDKETKDFVAFWFSEPQRSDLRRLSYVLNISDNIEVAPLRLALSRIIVTKKRGASLAWDVSHSRPHRVSDSNDFDVLSGFVRSATHIGKSLEDSVSGSVLTRRGDARRLEFIADKTIDLVVTSPPYLNAIDYLRGHRLALVWLGFTVGELRQIRGASVGSERGLNDQGGELRSIASDTEIDTLSPRMRGILFRYVCDTLEVMKELHRVLKNGASAVLVVGNSTVGGTFVDNASVIRRAGEACGFGTEMVSQRDLPTAHRYLPPPSSKGAALDRRMKTEVVLTLAKGY